MRPQTQTNAAAAREAGLNIWIVGQGGAVS
jgi:hypothetical protein